jgi:hypothetical protein
MGCAAVSDESSRFCAGCGAANPAAAASCLACRQPLPTGGLVASFGGRRASLAGAGGTGPLDGSPASAAANGGRPRERAWTDPGDDSPPAPAATPPAGGHHEPPPYVIRQQAFDRPAYGPPTETPPARRGSATGGCVMGLIALAVICALTAVLAGLAVGRPVLEDAVGDELEEVVATQISRELAASPRATPLAPGTYVIRAEEINRELAADPDAYDPIEDLVVTISPDGLEIGFAVFGLDSSYRGMVEVRRGRVVLTDVEASGAAQQILSAGEVREIVERELNDYFARHDLTIERVELGDGTLTVVAVPAGGATPAAVAEPTAAPPRAPTPARAEQTPTPRAASTRAPTPRLLEPPRTPTATDSDGTDVR